MLGVVITSLMGVSMGWCDDECFERAHPITTRWGFGKTFGGPELQYGFSVSTARRERVHRFQLGWAVPLGNTLEASAGLGASTDGRLEVVPGFRYSPFKLGYLLVPAAAVALPLSWRARTMELKVRPALELHVGLAVMLFALEIDVAGLEPLRYWWGVQVGL